MAGLAPIVTATDARPQRRRIRVTGIVQGVGFRPFVYVGARDLGLAGHVGNDANGVFIEIEGGMAAVTAFLDRLTEAPPPLARIDSVEVTEVAATGDENFVIVASSASQDSRRALISPDTAVCDACLAELNDPDDRRYGYPFINCTDCGPRFTITRDIPYDRHNTTMERFELCPLCAKEYSDPADRRFHAQPNACPTCGPEVSYHHFGTPQSARSGAAAMKSAGAALARGLIIAVKGIGGFHLACDARDAAAVTRLRERKRRDAKPLAVMVADLTVAAKLCAIDADEAALLQSVQRPIVLLPKRPDCPAAVPVAPGNDQLGVMLAYSPLHHLLLAACMTDPDGPAPVLVMTSANLSDDPIVYRDDEALAGLSGIADGVILHNRDIHMRCDDSVIRMTGEGPQFLRRSRGYAPAPLRLGFTAPAPVLACGAHLKNTFCLLRGEQAFVSSHIGDLGSRGTSRSYAEAVEHLSRLFAIEPGIVAHDLHPQYESTRYALRQAGATTIGVQHHEAHIASVMAEHRIDRPVIGVAADGTGYGHDGTIWGGEFLVGDFHRFDRFAHLAPMPLPGGEKAVRQPWRLGAVYAAAGLGPSFLERDLPFFRRLDREQWRVIDRMVERGIQTPYTSSMGRLFDAVAALCGLRDEVRYEGQAAMELEWQAAQYAPVRSAERRFNERVAYPFDLVEADGSRPFDLLPAIRAIVDDLVAGTPVPVVAFRFHTTVAALIATGCAEARQATGINTVVLGGGVFQNRLLLELVMPRLRRDSFDVRTARLVPPNDGGISLGQAAIAAHRAATL